MVATPLIAGLIHDMSISLVILVACRNQGLLHNTPNTFHITTHLLILVSFITMDYSVTCRYCHFYIQSLKLSPVLISTEAYSDYFTWSRIPPGLSWVSYIQEYFWSKYSNQRHCLLLFPTLLTFQNHSNSILHWFSNFLISRSDPKPGFF